MSAGSPDGSRSSSEMRNPATNPGPQCRLIEVEGLPQEPEPVLGGAAVLVVAQVGGRVEELRREVAVAGDDLDAVQAGPLEAGRGPAVAVGDLADLGQPERRAA